MGHLRIHNRSEAVALEACAGLALGCAYSSSDEYEAEVIQARRRAGAYGMAHRRQAYIAFGLAAAAIVAVLLVV